uniref:Uncharacterized protein n=1 Tax=Knipowitschia caucasica TaxID=637954 RepID=A0AAV2KXV5_KNICA
MQKRSVLVVTDYAFYSGSGGAGVSSPGPPPSTLLYAAEIFHTRLSGSRGSAYRPARPSSIRAIDRLLMPVFLLV